MADYPFNFTVVVQTFEDGTHLAEALLFPELSCYGDKLPRLRKVLEKQAGRILDELSAAELYRRRRAGTPEVIEVAVTLDPPRPPRSAGAEGANGMANGTVAAQAADGAAPVAWAGPIELRFHVVRWRHGEQAHLAFVPALGIEVVAATEDELAKLLPQHVRFALLRRKAATSLRELARLQRVKRVRLETLTATATVKTPKRLATDAAREAEAEKPVIKEVGVDLTARMPAPAWEIDDLVAQLADALGGRQPRSVLLVGKSGVGKTAAFHELVRRRERLQLGQTPFWATTGSRLVAGMSGFGMWQKRCQRLCREASRARAVLYLGNLVELMEVGRSTHNAQGIASFLRPYLARGEVLAVAECTPEQLAVIERADPHLAEVFFQIKVEEPSAEKTKAILLDYVLWRQYAARIAGGPGEAPLDEEALETIDRLHRRYATYSASPARPLRFLRNLLDDRNAERSKSMIALNRGARPHTTSHPERSEGSLSPADEKRSFAGRRSLRLRMTEAKPPLEAGASGMEPGVIGRREVIAAFARETGLPLFLLDEAVPLDLAGTRTWFASRVIGQESATDLVSDLVATVKAALNRPRRPIASLLFIGPTGVGKTEMAKSLAEFFFGDRDRMTRFDMSEYASPAAVERLVGSMGGAFGSEGLLTAKVREQPFSVVLLDEFEKAHPALFDLMLQVLGEGRLTDAAGRVADFSNAVVIMTSNLGAETYRQTPFGLAGAKGGAGRTAGGGNGQGVSHGASHSASHFVEAVRAFFRPELFNRIDRVVSFEPLGEEVVLRIARRELDLIRRRDGLRLRSVGLSIPEPAVAYLARAGFDARYGARPLKRAIERELLVPLAEGMNGYSQNIPLTAAAEAEGAGGAGVSAGASAEGGRLRVTVKAVPTEAGVAASRAAQAAAGPAGRAVALRRDMQRLRRAPVVLRLHNDIFELRRLQERLTRSLVRKAMAKYAKERRVAQAEGLEQSKASKLAEREARKKAMAAVYVGPENEPRLARLTRLTPVAEAIAALDGEVLRLEDELLVGLYGEASGEPPETGTALPPLAASQISGRACRGSLTKSESAVPAPPICEAASGRKPGPPSDASDTSGALAAARRAWDELLLSLYVLRFAKPDLVLVSVYGTDPQWLFDLTAAYRRAALGAGCSADLYHYKRDPAGGNGDDAPLLRYRVEKAAAFLAAPYSEPLGLTLAVSGKHAYARLAPEQGAHRFERDGRVFAGCWVDTTDKPLANHLPREPREQQAVYESALRPRRVYDLDHGEARDLVLGGAVPWVGRNWEQSIPQAMQTALSRAVAAMLEEEKSEE